MGKKSSDLKLAKERKDDNACEREREFSVMMMVHDNDAVTGHKDRDDMNCFCLLPSQNMTSGSASRSLVSLGCCTFL